LEPKNDIQSVMVKIEDGDVSDLELDGQELLPACRENKSGLISTMIFRH